MVHNCEVTEISWCKFLSRNKGDGTWICTKVDLHHVVKLQQGFHILQRSSLYLALEQCSPEVVANRFLNFNDTYQRQFQLKIFYLSLSETALLSILMLSSTLGWDFTYLDLSNEESTHVMVSESCWTSCTLTTLEYTFGFFWDLDFRFCKIFCIPKRYNDAVDPRMPCVYS